MVIVNPYLFAMLGSKFGAKVVKNKDFKKESVANSFETIQKCFQDIYEKLLALEHDIDELFELLWNFDSSCLLSFE